MTITGVDAFASATEMLRALRERRVSAVELLDLHLERIARYNPKLNAIVTPDYDHARQAAQAADAARARGGSGALLGLPLTIKDCIDVEGLPTTAGVLERAGHRAEHDALLVARVRAAGGVIMGKTNIPPLAGDWHADNPVFGRTNNPWDLTRGPGGSTGGGGAALAAGLTPLEYGSDIGGSIRVPAAFCGVLGHRPSATALPSSGHYPGSSLPNPASVLGVLGPLARSAGDLELGFDVAAGPEIGQEGGWKIAVPPARHERLAEFRVAVLPPLDWAPLDDEVHAGIDNLASALSRAGAKVGTAQPEGFGNWRAHYNLYSALLAVALTSELPRGARERQAAAVRESGDPFYEGFAHGVVGDAAQLMAWLDQREEMRATFREFFRDWDLLLAPITPAPPHPHVDVNVPMAARTLTINGKSVPYSVMVAYPHLAILSGQPATAFPTGLSHDGLPLGAQAIGPYLEDRTPIRFAALAADHTGGCRRPPGYE